MEYKYNKEEAYVRAKKKLDKLKGFYWHLFWYLAVNIFILISLSTKLGATKSIWHLEYFATPFFWGIGLFFHFLNVFGKEYLFGKQWEERKIDEFINKDKKRWE